MTKTLKIGIILLVFLCLVLLGMTFIDLPVNAEDPGPTETPQAPFPVTEAGEEDLIIAVEQALAQAGGHWEKESFIIDHIQIQDDGRIALIWLAPVDPETGALLGREPQSALAELDQDGEWQVLLEDDEKFADIFYDFQFAEKNIQGDFLSESQALPKTDRVFGGYYLPWAEGLEKRLTWSVAHTSCYPTYYCTHAFDFADGTMFPMVAAKGGTVYHWKDSCANGDTYCSNSITIQDRSTTPWTYQIYLHIAYDSIPDRLKVQGTPVMQGQFIANVDDTGYSSGHHVHFMVVSEDTKYISGNGYVWGVAEDITFKDVTINWDVPTQGGRPRLAYEAATYGGEGQTYYVSKNVPANPPTGGLTAPANKTFVTDKLLTVSGWGDDDIAVTKMEILANYDNNWVKIGSDQTANPFTTQVDLCDTAIPDGPFKLGLRVWDYEGNPSSILTIRKLIKNVECGTSGTDPVVKINLDGGVLALPQNGLVSANVTKGSTGSAISSVAFWFHGRDWSKDNWVLLGKDVNGSNGWQAPINTTNMTEASNYTIVAVATDAAGNMGAAANFKAIVDKTPPWVNVPQVRSPLITDTVTLNWTGDDDLSGLSHYSLAVNINSTGFQVLESHLPADTTSYQFSIDSIQLMLFDLTAYDKSGNPFSEKFAMYTEGYEFPESYSFPSFFVGE